MPSRTELANAIRALSMDAVQKAKSGHPGAPMGMADIAEVLWNDFLIHNPANPNWFNRDRFILSNGHGSMLLYSLLHLTGYDLSINDLKQFRQLHAKTAGHPEHGFAPGIETTTGPLGQGLSNAVGMALAEKILAAHFNRDGFSIVDHHTYVFVGDGCLMEGISHEVCSLAGTLNLGKLIVFYDDNGISIDGQVAGWFADDTSKRFEAYGWHVIPDVDGHNAESIERAVRQAKAESNKPTLICCKTVIGYGAPTKAGTHGCHGAPLGEEEIAATRKALGWSHAPFEIPDSLYQAWDAREKGQHNETAWQQLFDRYQSTYPKMAAEFTRRMRGQLPAEWPEEATAFIQQMAQTGETMATRKASLTCLNRFTQLLPELLGGSADLTDSNLTKAAGAKAITPENAEGDYLFYGVREFGMSAIMNGLALHGGFIPFGGTFLVFSDYARNAVRMAALMKQRLVHVYTHDSIGLGEDGPTHQPVEHLASLRLIPNLSVWRPCDVVESAVAWTSAIDRTGGPSCLVFSRQNCQKLDRDENTLANISRGGYILRDCEGTPDVILIATGSEVELAVAAKDVLDEQGLGIRVVSMPSTDVFDAQDEGYKASVLPSEVRVRVAIEAGVSDYWCKYVGFDGAVVGIDRFGESAPGGELMKFFGFTVQNIVDTVLSVK